MLQLVLGPAGAGKTTRLMAEIDRRAAAGGQCVLLVPEQFSAAAEGRAVLRFGDEKSARAEVLSFRTLAERILRQEGGLLLPLLDEAGRAVFVRRALEKLEALPGAVFVRQRRSAAFCGLCAQTLAELKTAGARPGDVLAIAERGRHAKLKEIALIYEAYEALLQGAAMDADDRLSLAARAEGGWLNGKTLFADGFDGFTAPQYALLRQAMCRGAGLWVALCCPGLEEESDGPGLFTPVRRAARRLLELAAACGAAAQQPLVLDTPKRPEAAGLFAVNRLLIQRDVKAGGAAVANPPPPEEPAECEGLYLTAAADEWEELRCAAAEMRRLALAGVPYGKMALVCRDVAAYESAARRFFALYGIPFFTDAPSTIEYTAPVAFIRAALSLLRGGLSGGGILALLKTGLCGYGETDVAALENYVFTWAPKAAGWRAPFTGNPDGLLAPMDEAARAQLAAAERLRGEVVPAVDAFLRKARKNSARALCKNIYLLMEHFDAPAGAQTAAERLNAQASPAQGEAALRAWDLAMQMLDRMAAILGDTTVSAAEYDELFLILVRSTDFSKAPPTLECVSLSGADRMRLDAPDYCFVVGLCEGEFPMQVGYSGLLTHNDRDMLVAGGIAMPGSFETRTLLEELFFYRALCAPRKALYLSWPRRRGGIAKTASAALEPLRALDPPPLLPGTAALAATPAAAFDLLGGEYRRNTQLAATLHDALRQWEAAGAGRENRALALLREADETGIFRVAEASLVEKLLGRDLNLSATVAQQYFSCPFSYYMERVLRVRPRRKAELSPLESGTFVHYILEKVLREAGPGFAAMSDAALSEAALRFAAAFIAENLPDSSRRGAARLARIQASAVRLLCAMRSAAAGSEFAVDAVELSVGGQDADVPALEIACADGRRVRVSGKIDRVDVLRREQNTFLCIVDYKTGDKRLDLKELWHGLNMQLVIYMDALCLAGDARYPNAEPAGLLYLAADPAPQSGERAGNTQSPLKLNGLLLNDAGILRALDADGSFLPISYKRDGSPRTGSQLAGREKFDNIRAHVRGLLAGMAKGVYAGDFAARPLAAAGGAPCAYCAYRAACRHEDGLNERSAEAPPDVFEPGRPAAPRGGENGEVSQ